MFKRFKFSSIPNRYKSIIRLILDNKKRLLVAMFLMILVAGTTAATAYLIEPVLDDIFLKQNADMLKIIPLLIVFVYFIRSASMVGQAYLMSFVGEEIIRRLRNDLFDRIQDLSLAFFQHERTGVLMSRITNDVNIVKAMVSTAVTGALRDCFTIVFLTGVIFYQDWKLATFAFLILPLAMFPFVKYGRRVRTVSTDSQETMADLSAFLHETFAGSKVVKAFCMENYEKKRFDKMTQSLFDLQLKGVIARHMSSAVMEFLAGLGIAFIIFYGGYRVIGGTSTPGTFFSFLTAVLLLYDPVRKLSEFNNAIQEGMAATNRVYDIIEIKNDIVEPENPILLSSASHGIQFNHVYFSYDQKPVLKDISLEVQSGQIIGIVGMSGGGKSSLVNLIPRFYDVTDGNIVIDGIDIRKFSIESLRKQIAIVTQEPILFNDTIKKNIIYGRPDATEDEIIEAAKSAYAYDFIMRLPNQMDTSIGELGGRLSGGEKQRLCIARALIKNAPILILDEATSSLDTEAENIVRKALNNLMKGRTTFVIAHRLSTIQSADMIIVLVNGEIVERGKHDTLLKKNGEYSKLYQMQFKQESSSKKLSVISTISQMYHLSKKS